MCSRTPDVVLTVADARAGLSAALKRFRDDGASDPVILGSHRSPEAALVPYALFTRLNSGEPNMPPVLDQLRSRRRLILRLAELSRIRSVGVFGSVARGTETAASDIDLLVDPTEEAGLFDLAQFALDMEELTGRTVDIVSRRALTEGDAGILAEAIDL